MCAAPPPPPVLNHPKEPKRATPIKVAVITHYFSLHGGGIESVAHHLLRELSPDESFTFIWLASACDPAPQIPNVAMKPMRCFNGLEKGLGFPWPLWSLKSLREMKQTIAESDIVWLHDTLYPGNILAFFAARRKKKPVIVTQHIAPIPYRNPVMRWLMRTADAWITTRILRAAHEVVFISDRVAEDYYRRVAFTRPIKVVPNGVDVRYFHAPIPENRRFLREQFALKKEQPVLLFVGRFVEKKGLEVIRRLATLLPEWRFWLAGQGPINPDKWLLPNVHVFKGRKGQSLADLYQAADLFLMPSYGEGFPLVIQEAMACGLPVICGPATAEGSRLAIPYLHVADVFPDNPERTAAVWFDKLKGFPIQLPLTAPLEDVAEFAILSWDWHPISRVYARMFTTHAPKG